MGPTKKYRSELISAGVSLECFHPGGKDGPNSEVLLDTPGGQVWSETVMLGEESDPFILAIPDIRLPANQLWPLHWHDCWVGIVILEGNCMIGDWWMKPGDVLTTQASLEYGPLLIGPKGCRMFEIFAQLHLSPGGYGLEYRDHPTVQGTGRPVQFSERSGVNKRNEGRSCLAIDGVKGFVKGRLDAGSQWDLGEGGDPERGIMQVTRLAPTEKLAAHRYDDWHAIVVMDGGISVAGRELARDDYLLMRPNSPIDTIAAGADGAKLLELSRTARGAVPRPVS